MQSSSVIQLKPGVFCALKVDLTTMSRFDFQIHKWTYTSLTMVMEVLQIHIVQQIMVVFEGLLPSMQEHGEEEEAKHKKPYSRFETDSNLTN